MGIDGGRNFGCCLGSGIPNGKISRNHRLCSVIIKIPNIPSTAYCNVYIKLFLKCRVGSVYCKIRTNQGRHPNATLFWVSVSVRHVDSWRSYTKRRLDNIRINIPTHPVAYPLVLKLVDRNWVGYQVSGFNFRLKVFNSAYFPPQKTAIIGRLSEVLRQ